MCTGKNSYSLEVEHPYISFVFIKSYNIFWFELYVCLNVFFMLSLPL